MTFTTLPAAALSHRPDSGPGARRLPLGANVDATGGVSFRVWAPKRSRVEVVLERDSRAPVALARDGAGYFTGTGSGIGAGALYRYRLDGGEAFPDPCSRYQPEGPLGPSMVVDPSSYTWRDAGWRGLTISGQVIYEIHVGTFTRAGTLDAAGDELPRLARLGVTLVELMPLADFPGRFNWGYDGVDLYAPAHVYGDPDALRRFVDREHDLGVGVILDVVYNHFGPAGSCLRDFADDYYTDRYPNEWGDAVNFDGPNADPVREFIVENACYWIREYHLDGLRLDATQSIHDASEPHVLAELSRRAREAAGNRSIVLIAENEPQDTRCVRPVEEGGFGLDAVWSDDFHHSARVALTGRREAYYTDYLGTPQELVSLVKRGFLYQGQRYSWQQKPRGSRVTSEPAAAFVFYLENHDQVANDFRGQRLGQLSNPGALRAMTALLLLGPQTPLLFMGQEFNPSSPFHFFADHGTDGVLSDAVHRGRSEFLGQFPSFATPGAQAMIPNPAAPSTFERSTLDRGEAERHHQSSRMYEDLLRLRHEDPVIAGQRRDRMDGAVLGSSAFVLRWFDDVHGDRLLVLNLGTELLYEPAPEPLLAPVSGGRWQLVWASDEPRYGGPGTVDPADSGRWRIPATSAHLFVAAPALPDAAGDGAV